ncbi:MAG: glycosyltransferase family 2 protein [Leeuwenhoekiella sp.]
MSKSLSIIIPMYNAEKYIARCIDSILNQHLDTDSYEVVIMNDGSTDSSPALVQEYIDAGHPIVLHSHANVGCDGTRNKGFKFATGEYIYIMDADDYLAYDTLKPILKRAFEDNLEIVAFDASFTGKEAWFEAEKNASDIDKPTIITGKEFIKQNRNTRFETWWFILKRSLLESSGVRFEQGNACSDTYYMLEHFLRAERVAYYPIEIYRYYDAPTSLTRAKNDADYIKRMLNDFGKTAVGFSDILIRLKRDDKNLDPRLWDNLTHRRDTYVFHYITMMVRAGYSKAQINEKLKVFKEKDAYPIKNFLGPEFNSPKGKLMNFIYNRKPLLFNLAPIYSKFQA